MRSSPVPPSRESSPSRPANVSLPEPPSKVSFFPPPVRLSCPAPPSMCQLSHHLMGQIPDCSAVIVSLPEPPVLLVTIGVSP
ncbi:hypothetical protein C7B76_06855 [filamentous cyanobacterium CCP2]|nr:hypothetical protein C7B76_06855 [filamentous cyanobacterium CCP2]